jgi:transposase-like protein
MFDSPPAVVVPRPERCPFCKGRRIDTLAKIITVNTSWRCRQCDRTWTIAGQAGAPPRNPTIEPS